MKLIGITGGVGAGKSEIISYLRQNYNCRVELADEVAHRLEEPGEECFDKLVALLGEEILKDGRIDKKLMANAIFANSDLIEKVNDIVHPAVLDYFLKEIAIERENNKIDFFFIEAALLIECGYEKIMDELWYVYASESTRRERLKSSRGYSDEKIDGIFKSQLSDGEFRAGCAFVIDNDGDIEAAHKQIDERLRGFIWIPTVH